jgi:calcium-dependent protein kinase
LLDELEAIGCFQEDDAAILLNHMLTCINYIHGNDLVHRDLKPENILLEENMKLDDIKIIDFGLAKRTVPGCKFNDFVGTSYYMSPQIVREEPYTNKCDIWACGVIAFLVLGGYAPFDGQGEGDESIDEICEKIEKGEVVFDDEPEVWDSVTDEAKEFIRFLLAYEEEDRPTAYEALQHPWLEKIRTKTRTQYRRSSSLSAKSALGNMEGFEANCKLKQATYALIASQLLLKSEKEEIDEVFRVLDVDCSGRLSKEEVKCGYNEFFGQELSDEEVNIIFKRVNFSGSGSIEYSEFVVASLMSKDLLNDVKLKAAFEEFDIDGNGYIDLNELKSILTMEDDMDDYVMNKIIKQVDGDGDGQISYEEFKGMMYITASQPSREEHETWMKRRESSTLSDESMDSSIGTRMSSLKSIAGARDVLSIFDVMSDASCRLDFDLDDSSSQQEQAVGNGRRTSVSLSGITRNEYTTQDDSEQQPGLRRNRTLPQRFDPRRGFLKVNFSFSEDRAYASLGTLPVLGEEMTGSERRLLDESINDA